MRRCVRAILLLGALAGCNDPRPAGPMPTPGVAQPAPPASQPKVEFARAIFLKPDSSSTEKQDQLAPLLVQELAAGGNDPASAPRPGRLERAGSALRVATDRSIVYWSSDVRQIGGGQHEQIVFTWFYPGDAGSLRWRWLRLTLDGEGFPCIAEVLSDDAGVLQIYASRALEEAAIKGRESRDRFGPFALIRPDAAGRARFAGVYEDGPIPMGPLVYLDAVRQHFAVVLCRCMPSQVRAITETGNYTLAPAEETCAIGACPSESQLGLPEGVRLPEWARAAAKPDWLARAIRLPEHF